MRRIPVFVLASMLFFFAFAESQSAQGQVLSDATIKSIQELSIGDLLKKAKAGDPVAQWEMGVRYWSGIRGVQQDYGQSAAWYRKAAGQGLANAENNLAVCYQGGTGVPQDYGQAAAWFRKAADQGNSAAANNLALMYSFAMGVSQDFSQARYWTQKAADQGDINGEKQLGDMYAKGLGGPRSIEQARIWYQKAADQEFVPAKDALRALDSQQQGQASAQPPLSEAQIAFRSTFATYQQMDFATLNQKAEAGDATAEFVLAYRYDAGILGAKQDHSQAAAWYLKAADQGLTSAENNLGHLYEHGSGVPQDYVQARAWYQKAADQGVASAENNLGAMFEQAEGGPQDYKQARYWYQKAADQENQSAEFRLGVLFQNGQGGPRDLEQARKWYQKAADQQTSPELKAWAQKALSSLRVAQQPNCDPNWSSRFDSLTSDPEGMRASIQQKLDGLISQYGGLDGTINEVQSEIESDQNRDDLSDEQQQSLISMNEGIIEILKCRQSMQQAQMAASSVQASAAEPIPAATTTTSTQPSAPAAPTPVDVRFFPNSDSRPLTDAEMRDLQNSLRWDPESAPLTQGGTARSNLVDDKGRTLGSVLVRWEKRAPGSTQATFTIQIQNATSCFFHSSAELDDAQGFIVVGGPVWAGWLTLSQPSAGETKQAQGRASVNGAQSLLLKPATAYSTLSGCMTPKSAQ